MVKSVAPTRLAERGFTYLVLLFAIALVGIGAASLGEQWQAATQREREAELLFRGAAIQKALEAYRSRTIRGEQRFPLNLDELVDDAREGERQFHLRRLYADPFTGRPDWLLLRNRKGEIVGIHSRSRTPALRLLPSPGVLVTAGPAQPPDDELRMTRQVRVGDWVFLAPGVSNGDVQPDPADPLPAQWSPVP